MRDVVAQVAPKGVEQQGFDFGRGAALGYLIALVIMVLAAVYLRLLGRTGRT